MYWAVISHLIHEVYHSDAKTREVMLDRAINGLKRCKERVGTEKYNEIMDIFASGNPEFNRLVQRMVRTADQVDFFDKLFAGPDGYGAPERAEGKGLFYRYH